MNSDYLASESTNPNQISQISINKSIYYSNNQKTLMSPLVKMSPLIIQNTSMKYNQGLNMISSQCGKDKWSTLPKNYNPFDFSLPINFDKIPKLQIGISQNKINEENNYFQQNNFFKTGFLQNDKFKIGKINSFLFHDFRNSSNKKEKETDKESQNFLSPKKNINYFSLSLKNENNNELKNNKKNNFENKKKRNKIKSRNKINKLKSDKENEKIKIEKAKLYKEKKKLKKLFQSKEENNIITENGVEYIHFLRKKRQLKEESLKKKEKKETKKKKPVKKTKKLDKTKINVQLNQIEINGFSLVKFPAVNNIPLEDQSVNLYVRMLVEENYFEVVNKYISDIPPLNEEKLNKQTVINKFRKIKHILNNLYLIDENKNENNPVNIIKNYYHQIKDTLLLIQKNFVGKKKAICNMKLCEILEKLIKSCNDITNTLTDYKKIGLHYKNDNNNKINSRNLSKSFFKERKKNHYKVYICEICNKALSNGQGLGGHMSRNHPNQSEKYKEKLSIRNKRLKSRKRLIKIKRMLFSKYNLSYDNFVKNNEKVKIRKFLLSHKDEYRRMKNHFVVQNKLLKSK